MIGGLATLAGGRRARRQLATERLPSDALADRPRRSAAQLPHRPEPPALIFGNEEKGLDPAILALCDEVATIPGSGRVQSLNVAAAAAILIHALTGAQSRPGRSFEPSRGAYVG
jgi:tRNA G18 (ribose-2'-O)-methylase SpoU